MNRTDRLYAAQADKEEGRDHDVSVAYKGRVVQSEGATGRAWLKYNAGQEIIWITDLYGKQRWLTRGQVNLYQLLLTLIDNGSLKMRDIAEKLGIAASTVSRGMAKLMAYGLIAYVSAKGRYGGTIILRRVKGDHLERFAQKARDRVRRWYQTAQDRLFRAHSNVASYVNLEETVVTSSTTTYGRNNRNWTPEELREAGII